MKEVQFAILCVNHGMSILGKCMEKLDTLDTVGICLNKQKLMYKVLAPSITPI